MSYVLKSRLYREEMLKWALVIALFAWAITATVVAASAKNEIVLVGVSDNESYLITPENKAHEQKELVGFVRKYLSLYYSFDEKTFAQNISAAGDLMSEELWIAKQPELEKLAANLKTDPLSQHANILSLDYLEDGKYEASIELVIHRKLDRAKALVKVNLRLERRIRTSNNVWPYEVTELTDAVL